MLTKEAHQEKIAKSGRIPICRKCKNEITDWEGHSFDWCKNCNNYQDIILINKNINKLLLFYQEVKQFIIREGYQNDITWCENIKPLSQLHPTKFYDEYVWCVLSAGMKEQVVRKIYNKFIKSYDIDVIKHEGKRRAIDEGYAEFPEWYNDLISIQDTESQIEFLETLPWIGKVTKYHLARNIGIDCVKPDRHLKRLADQFGFETPLKMCQVIQSVTNERLGVIDVILWRYCNLKGQKGSRLQ